MSKEQDIAHENGDYWVLRSKEKMCYFVMVSGATHSTSESAYPLNSDGLSIAIARADYLANRKFISPYSDPTRSRDQ